MKSDMNRKEMLCHKWIQFAFKNNGSDSPKAIDNSMAKECDFHSDGSYEESSYNNTLKISGHWFTNPDQSKIGFTYEQMNGQKLPVFPDTTKRYNMVIIKLTKDTLIYGQEAYYGKDKVYGHSDWYFVRKD
jgi:hypothetical protein